MMNPFKTAGIGTLSLLLGSVLSVSTAQAGNSFFDAPVIQIASTQGINGYNVDQVNFDGGSFIVASSGVWIEQDQAGYARFEFVETNRDEWSVYLRDNGRGVNIQLDLHRKAIVYSDDNGQKYDLYQVRQVYAAQGLNAPNIGNAASSFTQTYSCNEGIPLVLHIENIGADSFVTWQHDGFQGNRLAEVVSGSGSKYSDGRNTIWMKGNEASVNLDGIEDYCTEN